MKFSLSLLLALLVVLAVFLHETSAQDANARKKARKQRRRQQRRLNRQNQNNQQNRRNNNRQRQRDCGPIPHVPFGAALHDGTPTEQQYACQAGFVLLGTDVIQCVDGIWATAPRCVQQSCPQAPSVPFATFVLSNFGLTSTYTCTAGYAFTAGSSSQIRCSFSRQTWATAPVCQPTSAPICGAPPTVGNATSTVSATGNQATYTCNTGYKAVNGRPTIILCVGFVWQAGILPACEPRNPQVSPTSCGKPSCGGNTIDPASTGDSTDIGGTVVYTCREGLRITGSNNNNNMTWTATCGSDGNWPTPPTCEPKNCGPAPDGINTDPPTAPVTTVGSVAVYTCQANHDVANPALLSRTCQVDGTWSGTDVVCSLIECPVSAIPTYANAEPGNANNMLAVGATRYFFCNTGYVLFPITQPNSGENRFEVQCLANRTYSPSTASCVYQYPASCEEFAKRRAAGGNPIGVGATAVTAEIDLDGAGNTHQPITILCSLAAANQVCTEVAPNFGSGNSFPTGTTCASSTTPGEFSPGALSTDDQFCNSAVQSVAYVLSEPQLVGLIGDTLGTCSQRVTFACGPAASNNAFLGLVTNRAGTTDVTTTLYAYQYSPGSDLLAGNAVGSACDCSTLASTCVADCNCGVDGVVTSDTITLYLTNENPNYVTGTIIGATGASGVLPAGFTSATSATVGGIRCCHMIA